jgi:hypothetical protein
LDEIPLPTHTTASQPADSHAAGSQNLIAPLMTRVRRTNA